MDIREEIRSRPMTGFQIRAIAICLVLNMIDGFDVLVMPFAAPSVARQWHLSEVYVGWLLSASLGGMALGSFLIAPFADRIGRRPLTIISLVLVVIGMTAAAFSPNANFLFAMRVLSGLGIGGMISNITVIVNEYSNARRRALAVGVYAAGYPVGATVGGLISEALISHYGWHSAFFLGAGLTLVLTILSVLALPESYEYLLESGRDRGRSLERFNGILHRMGLSRQAELPRTDGVMGRTSNPVSAVFAGGLGAQTLITWVGYALLTAAFYFANSWTTKLVAETSGNAALGLRTNILFNAGGAVGSALFGLLAARFAVRRLLVVAMVFAAVAYALFGAVISHVYLAMLVGALAGFAATSGISGVYSLGPSLYGTRIRGTGMGLLVGIGRVTSFVAPFLVGYIREAGVAPARIYQGAAIPLLASALAFVMLGVIRRRQGLNPEPMLAGEPGTPPALSHDDRPVTV